MNTHGARKTTMRSRVAFIGLALLASVSFDASAQITLAPLADAYVRDGGNATKNFGKATTLQVSTATKAGDNYDTYLKFETTAVPASSRQSCACSLACRPTAV